MNGNKILSAFAAALVLCSCKGSCGFEQKSVWTDVAGNPLNAHGAGIMLYDGVYYMYGEYKVGETRLNDGLGWECYRTEYSGVSCYSSTNLLDWKFEGVVLGTENDPESDLNPSRVVERPKVVYNASTGKFVMWMHIDSDDYRDARAGVAVADTPTGPFSYIGSLRPNGEMSRDQTLFVDEDGSGWQICSSENNETLHINRLSDDYLTPTGEYYRVFAGASREAPAICRMDGKYYLLTSACSGWDPNAADIAVADSLSGEWTSLGNPCAGEGSDITFGAQSTCFVPAPDGGMVACFDVWNKLDLEDSRYVWLPVDFKPDGGVQIAWNDRFFGKTEL